MVGSGVGNAAGGRAFSFTCPSCEAARGDAAGTTGFCGTCVPRANASSSSGPRSQRRSRARNPRTGLTAAGFSEDGGSASALGGPAWAAGFGAAALGGGGAAALGGVAGAFAAATGGLVGAVEGVAAIGGVVWGEPVASPRPDE